MFALSGLRGEKRCVGSEKGAMEKNSLRNTVPNHNLFIVSNVDVSRYGKFSALL